MSDTLFRKSSLDSLSSPEQLNDYIKVSNPGVWMILAALFILLAAVLFWGFTGGLPTSIHTRGVISGGNALCYINTDAAGAVKAGQGVKIQPAGRQETISGQVDTVGPVPMSVAEIAADLHSDYLSQALATNGFAVKVVVSVNGSDIPEGTLLDLSIVTDAVRPIDFLLK
ncbi:MAG: hypothetical protein BWY65_01202 [Firmicutes bacterium ADurb.Bin373]|nr:hypothetical protein [Bacillota bacterium]OQA09178.1 MAG: hypothetical protein BWY65_01202 [Firmicutes bacterium ADurb.Bin373]